MTDPIHDWERNRCNRSASLRVLDHGRFIHLDSRDVMYGLFDRATWCGWTRFRELETKPASDAIVRRRIGMESS
jgi:hypothetical protein